MTVKDLYKDRIWFDGKGKPRLCGTFVKNPNACGTDAGYTMGCRGGPCRKANQKHWKRQAQLRKKNAFIPIEPVREHLLWLYENGAVYKRIAEKLDISVVNVRNIANQKGRVKVFKYTGEAILGLHLGISDIFEDKTGHNVHRLKRDK